MGPAGAGAGCGVGGGGGGVDVGAGFGRTGVTVGAGGGGVVFGAGCGRGAVGIAGCAACGGVFGLAIDAATLSSVTSGVRISRVSRPHFSQIGSLRFSLHTSHR